MGTFRSHRIDLCEPEAGLATATFGKYWQVPEFSDHMPRRDGIRLDQALSLLIGVGPEPYWAVAPEILELRCLR